MPMIAEKYQRCRDKYRRNFDGYRQKRQRKTVEVTQGGGAKSG